MRINKIYLEASFVSFVIHASIILYLLGFFYFESQERSLLSKPIEVSLIFQDNVKEIKKNNSILETKNFKINEIPDSAIDKKSISFDSLIPSISLNDLIAEDKSISTDYEENQIDILSSYIIENIQSAWRKPINIQDGLVCDLRLSINKNGRIIDINLIKSSGNLRFDNSALKAVQRVETFSFLQDIPMSIYNSNFRSIVITFNPS
ncbi:MAG: LytB protein [Gammaproteobacteria bacterium]|jgi:TonB family protein|nr:LytB protein [Gammaproteobacteria bacterium]|tara:strand:+ start:2642 stop:3259 length:618 start_codon:yes stop_codon:yes gene_type:complete